jgi:hypothetical protein
MELVKRAVAEKNGSIDRHQFRIKSKDNGEEILIIFTLWRRNNYFRMLLNLN